MMDHFKRAEELLEAVEQSASEKNSPAWTPEKSRLVRQLGAQDCIALAAVHAQLAAAQENRTENAFRRASFTAR